MPHHISLLGTGPLAELLAQKIAARADLLLLARLASGDQPPTPTQCVIFLPTLEEIANGSAAAQITALLQAGCNVVSTVPAAALDRSALLAACRSGAVTYHGSGGFQNQLIVRFNRAFASITRNIKNVQLIEELDLATPPGYPWQSPSQSPADTGMDAEAADQVESHALSSDVFYQAGLHTLAEAIFADTQAGTDAGVSVSVSVQRTVREPDTQTGRFAAMQSIPQIEIKRALGETVAYDSIWREESAASVPLVYRLNTCSSDAIGHLTIEFHRDSALHPADHLTCSGLLDAIAAVIKSAPGILHPDLDINHVKSDDRL